MSRRREDIDNGIYGDPDFAALAPLSKLVYIWSFTNSHAGMAGLYKLRRGTAAFELGLSDDEEAEAFAELERTRFAFYRDGVVFVRTRVRHLRTRGENMAKSIAADVDRIAADHSLRAMFVQEYAAFRWPDLHEQLGRVLANPSDTLPEGSDNGTHPEARGELAEVAP